MNQKIKKPKILLPGLMEQFSFLKKNIEFTDGNILVIGSHSEFVASELADSSNSRVFLINHNHESLTLSRINLGKNKSVITRMMEYENTDFKDDMFDIVYAQGSISIKNRKKITKEIFRILKTGGLFCCGELIKTDEELPRFITDLWNRTGVDGIFIKQVNDFYTSAGFNIVKQVDLSQTLKEFYEIYQSLFLSMKSELTEEEVHYQRKLFDRLNHEINIYLKLGGLKHIGFHALLLRKEMN